MVSFTTLLRTPRSGCSQLPITAAVTKGKEMGAALAGSAWTWVSSAFITDVDRIEDTRGPLGFHPSPVVPETGVCVQKPTQYTARAVPGSGPAPLNLSIGPYHSPARSQLRAVVRIEQDKESLYAGALRRAEFDRRTILRQTRTWCPPSARPAFEF